MRVAICIPTFRRPEGLRKLLASLDQLTFTRVPPPGIRVFVIDNDAADPLGHRIGDIGTWTRHPLDYRVEPSQGLVHARNAALAAVDSSFDAIAFIDDDEWAEPQWLDALLEKFVTTQAAVVHGPVRPVFETEPAQWMRLDRYFEVGPFDDGARLTTAASGNCLLSKAVLDRLGLTFDLRFNMSGGEDVAFFDRLVAHGEVIVAAADAVAYETIPAARISTAWILRRRFRSGHTLGAISLASAHRGRQVQRVVKSLQRIGFGLVQTASLGLFSPRYRMKGATNIAFALGSLAALARREVDQYGAAPAAKS